MKTAVFFLASIIFLSFASPEAIAQNFLEKLKQKQIEKAKDRTKKETTEKAENEVENEVDKKTDQALDAIFGGGNAAADPSGDQPEGNASGKDQSGQQAQQKAMQKYLNKMGISSEPADIQDNYTFDSRLKMKFENYEANGKLKSDGIFEMYTNPGENNFAYRSVSGSIGQEQTGIIIYDYKNNATIILSEDNGKKTGVVYGLKGVQNTEMDDYQEEMEDQNEIPDNYANHPNIRRGSDDRKILGYNCKHYIYEDEEHQSNVWMTDEIKWNSKDFIGNIYRSSMYSSGMPYGFVMYAKTEYKNSDKKDIMEVVEVNENANTSFATNQYELVNLGNMNMPQDQGAGE